MTQPASGRGPLRRRLGPLGAAVDRQLARLQREYLVGLSSARAELAQLRRGLGKEPGSVPEIWDLTVSSVPPALSWDRDDPSRAEHAAHVAMTLYALHQQSQPRGVHQRGISLGRACARLRTIESASEQAVTRRFMAAATSTSVGELLIHARGLISQLRAHDVGLDYAMFADDVLALLDPRRQADVRLRWGRDFYRSSSSETSTPDVDEAVDDIPNQELE